MDGKKIALLVGALFVAAVTAIMAKNMFGTAAAPQAVAAIAPQPTGDLTWVKAGYHSLRGQIHSDWQRTGSQFQLTVTIPPNTSAEIHVPLRPGGTVQAPDCAVPLRTETDGVVYQVGPGHHVFVSAW